MPIRKEHFVRSLYKQDARRGANPFETKLTPSLFKERAGESLIIIMFENLC